MPKPNLLPGVQTPECPPLVVCDAHAAIRRARRGAVAREIVQLGMILAVDYLYVRWPHARMPFLDRGQSLMFLRGMNALIIAHVGLARAMPKLWARRIATTWSRAERDRFMHD